MKESDDNDLIEISEATESVWFPFQTSTIDPETEKVKWDDPILKSDGSPKAAIQIRLLSPFYEERIGKRKQIKDNVYNPKSRSMDRRVYLEELSPEAAKVEREDAIDYAITGFYGFGKSKKPLEVTRENKLLLIRQPAIDRFFAYCQERLGELTIDQKKAEAENFTNGSNGQTSINPD